MRTPFRFCETVKADRCCRELHSNSIYSEQPYASIWSYFTYSSDFSDHYYNLYSSYVNVIESWIHLLMDSPMPEVGKSCLSLQLLPSVHSAITFALPDPTRLRLVFKIKLKPDVGIVFAIKTVRLNSCSLDQFQNHSQSY